MASHDKFNLNHLKTCEICQSYNKKITAYDLIKKKFTHSNPSQKISFIQTALKVLLLLNSLRLSILEFSINKPSPIILEIQEKLLKATEIESVKIEEIAVKFFTFYDRFIIIEDSFDALNVIMNLFHNYTSCDQSCPFHKNVFTEFIVKSCSLSLIVGNQSFYKLCEVKNETENVFRQYVRQINSARCLICKEKCQKNIGCNRGYEFLCFKLENSGQLFRYDSVLPIRISSTDLFNDKNIGDFQLSLLITSDQKFFVNENNILRNEDYHHIQIQNLFETFYSNNIQILGVIYSLVKNQRFIQAKSKKMSDVTCKCGNLFEVGESQCRKCGTTMLFGLEKVEKKPNLKYKRDEEKKSEPTKSREIQIKSKKTKLIEKIISK